MQKRIKNKELCKQYTVGKCWICGKTPVCGHHLIRKAAGGHDIPENLFKCCWGFPGSCHDLFHNHPLTEMSKKFTQVSNFLIENGWELVDFPKKKYIPPFNY